METVRVPLAGKEYDILVGTGLLAGEPPGAIVSLAAGRRCLVITDRTVQRLYHEPVSRLLGEAGPAHVGWGTFPAGEAKKTLATAGRLCRAAVRAHLDRTGLIVALGGGVPGDVAGFVAAIYMRGVDLIQVPTTLLAQVDSSVGGKTAVDLPEGKNLVGAFHQPRLVLADVTTLRTLDARQLRCGLAEVLKYGVILDAGLFALIEREADALLRVDEGVTTAVVRRCCELKAAVVAADEEDRTGQRAVLNYGHTFGHALETLGRFDQFTHGEAVAIGMGMAADLACHLADSPALRELVARQDAALTRLGLPTRCRGFAPEDVLQLMRRDKKAVGGRHRLVLPDRLGQARVVKDVPDPAVRLAIGGRCDQ